MVQDKLYGKAYQFWLRSQPGQRAYLSAVEKNKRRVARGLPPEELCKPIIPPCPGPAAVIEFYERHMVRKEPLPANLLEARGEAPLAQDTKTHLYARNKPMTENEALALEMLVAGECTMADISALSIGTKDAPGGFTPEEVAFAYATAHHASSEYICKWLSDKQFSNWAAGLTSDEQAFAQAQKAEETAKALAAIPETGQEQTLQEVGNQLGCTRERVRQVEALGLAAAARVSPALRAKAQMLIGDVSAAEEMLKVPFYKYQTPQVSSC